MILVQQLAVLVVAAMHNELLFLAQQVQMELLYVEAAAVVDRQQHFQVVQAL
jgi:hypothetical protein